MAEQAGGTVHLSDVAKIELGAEDDRSVARYNGIPSVGLGVVKQQKASTVEVAQRVKKALPELRALLPAGMNLDIAFDSSKFIEDSMHEVVVSLFIAFALVIVVIWLFLGSLRATLIPAIAVLSITPRALGTSASIVNSTDSRPGIAMTALCARSLN